MALIAEHLGRNVARIRAQQTPDGAVLPGLARLGFELELERHEGQWADVDGWDMTDDGSLRGNRIEYIFNGPAGGAVAEARIKAMAEYLAAEPVKPTFRCSTHVHMDMQLADWNVYEKTVLAYMVFEDSFFDQVEPERRHSNFCIPFMNNDWFASYFGRNVIGQRDEHHKFHFVQRWSKYSALNLNVTAVHGSIEFRGGHALTTEDEMMSQALRMLSVRQMAESYKDLTHLDFVNKIHEGGIAEFIPGSFRADYVPDEGGIMAGVASALLAITAGELEGNDVLRRQAELERERLREEQMRAQIAERERQQQIREATRVRVSLNPAAFQAVNVATPHSHTLRGVAEVVMALRGMGIVTTVTALLNVDRRAAAAIQLLAQNLEEARAHIPRLTAEIL